jgi:hypothetical protein
VTDSVPAAHHHAVSPDFLERSACIGRGKLQNHCSTVELGRRYSLNASRPDFFVDEWRLVFVASPRCLSPGFSSFGSNIRVHRGVFRRVLESGGPMSGVWRGDDPSALIVFQLADPLGGCGLSSVEPGTQGLIENAAGSLENGADDWSQCSLSQCLEAQILNGAAAGSRRDSCRRSALYVLAR